MCSIENVSVFAFLMTCERVVDPTVYETHHVSIIDYREPVVLSVKRKQVQNPIGCETHT